MLRFQRYPIYIIYSLHRQKSVAPLWSRSYQERQNALANALRQLLKTNFGEMRRFLRVAQEKEDLINFAIQWQLTDDLDPKYHKEIRAYESEVEGLLNTISHTSVGLSVLGMLRADANIFIIPADWSEPTAITKLRSEAEGGGIRIEFNPSVFRRVLAPGPTDAAEDTLLHELVHAMRMSANRYGPTAMRNSDFGNTEEFIATQFENIFHAARRRSDFYSAYKGDALKKDAMYQYLAEDTELVDALEFFMQNEPLAKATAHLRQPEYNPFRDLGLIEKRSRTFHGAG